MSKRRLVEKFNQPSGEIPTNLQLLMTEAELKEESGSIPSMDLHGLDEFSAKNRLDYFINHLFITGQRSGQILHGKGTGKLALLTSKVLEEYKGHGIVEAYQTSKSPLFAGAAVLFILAEKE